MRTLLFLVLTTPLAAQCGSDCKFIRGDADCDGDVDNDDIDFISDWLGGGTAPVRRDAADTNDDGVNNVTDITYLSGYLNLGGPAPPCPLPTLGLDSVGFSDNLDPCYSHNTGTIDMVPDTWSHVACSWKPSWDYETWPTECVTATHVNNKVTIEWDDCAICTSEDYCSDTTIHYTTTDTKGFTKRKLANDVQLIEIGLDRKYYYEVDVVCDDPFCDQSASLDVETPPSKNTRVCIDIGPIGGPFYTVCKDMPAFDPGECFFLQTEVATICALQLDADCTSDHEQSDDLIDYTADVLSVMNGQNAGDCDVWIINEVKIDNFAPVYDPNGYLIDPSEIHKVFTELKAFVAYRYEGCDGTIWQYFN